MSETKFPEKLIGRETTDLQIIKALTDVPVLRSLSKLRMESKSKVNLPYIIGAPGTGKSAEASAITQEMLKKLAAETQARFMPEADEADDVHELFSNVLDSHEVVVVRVTFNHTSMSSGETENTVVPALVLRIIWG